MKKSILIPAVLLTAALIGTALSGCGSNADADSVISADASKSAQTQTSTHADGQPKTVNAAANDIMYPLPTETEDAAIYVEPIPGISDDFIRGMDVSSILAEENSGVVYYTADGVDQDVFTIMAKAGVNYARIRIWNDPYDEDGNGYGGGNNDLSTAIALGKRATENGMKVCIDFHYSDFWADPSKQMCPKAWAGMTTDEKSDALYTFTKESLTKLLDADVNVCMVQIGNETNNGMAGETQTADVAQLMSAGSRAVREIAESYGRGIKIALHYTDVQNANEINSILSRLSDLEADYDIFALSYYPYWHGSLENLQNVMTNIRDNYGKETLVAETAYCYTLDDSDGYPNIIGENDLLDAYGATVQSQSTALRDVCAAADAAGALGVFYWEGAWIAVGDTHSDNSGIWEENGSGWASSYAAAYDPNDAGKYYGGCAWDNQAMFDADGRALESLNTFKWLKHGTNADPAIDIIPSPSVTCKVGEDPVFPETVDVVYNNRSLNTAMPVEWYEEQLLNIDTSTAGTYEIYGRVLDETVGTDHQTEVSCTVNVME